jgi:hypothetical protein
MLLRLTRIFGILLAPLLLASCVLTPGKFTSTLTILANRHFTFSYVGEVYALEGGDQLKSLGDLGGAMGKNGKETPLSAREKAANEAQEKADADTRNRAIAEALSKEEGYRSAVYVGDGKFLIDYTISGTLDHGFVYPYNIDAEAFFPFIAIEVRRGGTVRVNAPGFANGSSKPGDLGGMGGGMSGGPSKLDGSFTLITDAEIVSQNNEDGPTVNDGRKTIVWKATPLTKTAPTAVLKLAR